MAIIPVNRNLRQMIAVKVVHQSQTVWFHGFGIHFHFLQNKPANSTITAQIPGETLVLTPPDGKAALKPPKCIIHW